MPKVHSARRYQRCYLLLAATYLAIPMGAGAQNASPAPTDRSQKAQAAPKPGWHLFGSWRVRPEIWDWFPTPKADGSYTFVGSVLRIGVENKTPNADTLLELEQPSLIGLPTKAIATAPQGQLGLGASYYAANHGQVASAFLKQGYVRFKNLVAPGNSLRVGRFEFSDSAETTSTDPSLAYLKRARIAERLIGPFGFTHVGRSFDGFQFAQDRPGRNVTAMLSLPTRGAFSLRGMDTLTDIRLAYLATTFFHADKKGASEGRLFGIYYEDQRHGVVKTDNRPAAVRATDKNGVHITTIGGNYLRVLPLGAGKADGLLWAAGQFGDWGPQRQGAFALAAEAGYQWDKAPWKPWFRLGYYYASGDGNSKNNQHGTFFPILPTVRIYARDPFFSETNLQDAFAQVILRPNSRLTLRADAHKLALADQHDLWYVGGGAFENATFGYTGRPSGGSRGLATLLDLSADYQLQKSTSLTFYFAYANGDNVVRSSYTGRDSTYAYVELTHKF